MENSMFMIRYAIMFQKDGLDREWAKNYLGETGKVIDEIDDMLDDIPIVLYVVESTLSGWLHVKLNLHCVTAKDNMYFLMPMENEQQKGMIEVMR